MNNIEKSQREFMQSVEFAEEEPVATQYLHYVAWFAVGFCTGYLLTVFI